ncbi:hypothetical protein CYMTET_43236, partial [Cymbomonas tetramitiformis]
PDASSTELPAMWHLHSRAQAQAQMSHEAPSTSTCLFPGEAGPTTPTPSMPDVAHRSTPDLAQRSEPPAGRNTSLPPERAQPDGVTRGRSFSHGHFASELGLRLYDPPLSKLIRTSSGGSTSTASTPASSPRGNLLSENNDDYTDCKLRVEKNEKKNRASFLSFPRAVRSQSLGPLNQDSQLPMLGGAGNNLFRDLLAGDIAGLRRAALLGVLGGPLALMYFDQQKRSGISSKKECYAALAGTLGLWQAALLAALLWGLREWAWPLGAAHAVPSCEPLNQLAASAIASAILLLWIGLTLLGVVMYRRVDVRYRKDINPSSSMAFTICAMLLGPFGLLYVYSCRQPPVAQKPGPAGWQSLSHIATSGMQMGEDTGEESHFEHARKIRVAALSGFALQTALLMSIMGCGWLVRWPGCALYDWPLLACGVWLMAARLAIIAVLWHRRYWLPGQRPSALRPGFFHQTILCTRRALRVIGCDRQAISFDLGGSATAGVFLCIAFYGDTFALSPSAPSQVFDDPIIKEASLAVAFTMVASTSGALNVYGPAQRKQVQIEAAAGYSTEAYFLANSLAHLPYSLISPLALLIPYYLLDTVRSQFWQTYLLLASLHFSTAGWAYCISIACSTAAAPVVAGWWVVWSMLFSGAVPTLHKLRDADMLGGGLAYLSYLSLGRWAQNAFYLDEVSHYRGDYDVDAVLETYSYSFTGRADLRHCYAWIWCLGLLARVVGYVLFVRQEL